MYRHPPSLRKNRERSLLSRFFLREEGGTSLDSLLLMVDESTVHGNKAMVRWFVFHSLISRAIFGERNGRQAVNVVAFRGFSWVLKNGEQFSTIGTLIDQRWCGQNKCQKQFDAISVVDNSTCKDPGQLLSIRFLTVSPFRLSPFSYAVNRDVFRCHFWNNRGTAWNRNVPRNCFWDRNWWRPGQLVANSFPCT